MNRSQDSEGDLEPEMKVIKRRRRSLFASILILYHKFLLLRTLLREMVRTTALRQKDRLFSLQCVPIFAGNHHAAEDIVQDYAAVRQEQYV